MGCSPSVPTPTPANAVEKPPPTQKPPKNEENTESPANKPKAPKDNKHHNNVHDKDNDSIDTEVLPPSEPPNLSEIGKVTQSVRILDQVAAQREQEHQISLKRRASAIAAGRDEEEIFIEEMFMFGDFAVAVKKEVKKKKPEPEMTLIEENLEQQIVKEYLEKKFTFSDFSFDLEELIMHDHVNSNGPRTNDREAYRFAFGDFAVGVTEEQVKANAATGSKLGHAKINNYSMYNLLGHSTRVKCICLSPNEKFYVSSSAKDATIVMYDIKSGREFLYFDGHEDTIIGAHFSNDGKHLATASRDNTLILWDTVIGKQIFVFEHERIVICCCFSRDGKYIVSGCQDKVCRVWSTKKGKELLAFKEHEGIITAVSYSPSGENIVSASSDKTLKIWNSTSGVCIATIPEHGGIVMACMYSFDGTYIVSNDEKVVNVWDVKKSKVSLSLPVDHVQSHGPADPSKKRTWTICSCCPSNFCYYIVAACSDRNVYILHPQTGEVVLSFLCKAAVYCMSSGSKNTLTLGDAHGNVYVVTLY